jgi:prepilin-type N-terminal cleavage/methylation domain-containing protein
MKRRPAFTLIEILIVIFIIGILTVVVIANYGAARQKAKADLIADTLINTIKVQQNAAKSGKGASPQCYGVYFDVAGEPHLQTVTAPYVSVSAVGFGDADYCDMSQKNTQKLTDLEDFAIDGIDAFGDPQQAYLIMFKPPEANVVGGNSLEARQTLNADINSIFEVTFRSQDGLEVRKVSFDIATGRAQKSTVSPAGAQ